jgi:hypothetical protein
MAASTNVAPTITSFTSTTADGYYKAGATVNITATASVALDASSQIRATLATGGSGRQVLLTRDGTDATKLVGEYTIQAGDTTSDLTVASYALGGVSSANIPKDVAGNVMASTTLPASNIAGSKAIVVDTTAPSAPSIAELNSTDLEDGLMNASESTTTTFRVTLPTTGSMAVEKDTVELLLGGSAFGAATRAALNATHFSQGYVDFTVLRGDLGADGVKSLTAKITDVAGNQGTASIPVGFTLDTKAPEAIAKISVISNDTGVSAKDYITNQTIQTANGTLSKALAAGEKVQISGDVLSNAGQCFLAHGAVYAGPTLRPRLARSRTRTCRPQTPRRGSSNANKPGEVTLDPSARKQTR